MSVPLSSFEYAGEARAALRAIMSDPEYGAAAFSASQVMTNLLRDYLPDAPRETGLLIAAASAGLSDMIVSNAAQGLDVKTAVILAAASLKDSTAFPPEACEWVSAELAIALGLACDADLPPGSLQGPADGPGATKRVNLPADDATTVGHPAVLAPDIPAPPVPEPDEMRPDSPFALTSSGRHSIGWQGWTTADGGPGFVTLRRGALGGLKVIERYPLTDQGWAATWRALLKLEPDAAGAVRAVLTDRARRDRSREMRRKLDARSSPYLPEMVLISGHVSDAHLRTGRPYDVRFLEDHIAVLACRGLRALAVIPLREVVAVDALRPDDPAIGTSGPLLARSRFKAIVHVRTANSEVIFANTASSPDALRADLARARQAVPTKVVSTGELARLAGLLESGLLTRDEFEHLKARLLQEG